MYLSPYPEPVPCTSSRIQTLYLSPYPVPRASRRIQTCTLCFSPYPDPVPCIFCRIQTMYLVSLAASRPCTLYLSPYRDPVPCTSRRIQPLYPVYLAVSRPCTGISCRIQTLYLVFLAASRPCTLYLSPYRDTVPCTSRRTQPLYPVYLAVSRPWTLYLSPHPDPVPLAASRPCTLYLTPYPAPVHLYLSPCPLPYREARTAHQANTRTGATGLNCCTAHRNRKEGKRPCNSCTQQGPVCGPQSRPLVSFPNRHEQPRSTDKSMNKNNPHYSNPHRSCGGEQSEQTSSNFHDTQRETIGAGKLHLFVSTTPARENK